MSTTPAQRQYIEMKKQYKDCILFFRMGDFYETFYEDAKICSNLLDITLTYRDKQSKNPIPMAGVPYHSSEKYIHKLVTNWYKVAVAEQTTSPKPGQIVEREVISVVTPGTMLSDTYQDYNFICSIVKTDTRNSPFHICYADFSVGFYFTKSFDDFQQLLSYIIKINPQEIVLDVDIMDQEQIKEYIKAHLPSLVNIYEVPFDSEKFLQETLNINSTQAFWSALEQGRKQAAALLLNYIAETQKQALKNISKIQYVPSSNKVNLDETTIRNLELLSSQYEQNKQQSLFAIINNTNTAIGKRMLYDILLNPINDLQVINKRLEHIQYFYENPETTSKLNQILKSVNDIPRIVSNIVYKKNLPNIWNKLKLTLRNIYQQENPSLITSYLEKLGVSPTSLEETYKLYQRLEKALKDPEEYQENDFIKEGYSQDIDQLRELAYNSDQLLLEYRSYLVETTGLQSLKVKYITNQWYLIEVSKKDSSTLEKFINKEDEKFDFNRKQTLKQQERYTTSYLEKVQQEVITSQEKLNQLEKQILDEFKNHLENISFEISEFAENLGYLDVFASFGEFAEANNWCKPRFNQEYNSRIKNWRHPVIEKFLPKDENFIPNDLEFDKNNFLHLITWPNMGWKSTFLRQNAIIFLLAHCWFYVPAEEADLCIIDGIFARVWSGDVLAQNQSTFMREMLEVSNIVNNATSKSFIILDELGRWTSTYDGVALAQSIAEHIAKNIQAKTLFATHYHELIKLEDKINWVSNFSVAVYETDKQVVFLKKITKWGANKSYGIDVAKIAGLPKEITTKAEEFLKELESSSQTKWQPQLLFQLPHEPRPWDEKARQIKEKLDQIDTNNITPMQALEILNNLKNM